MNIVHDSSSGVNFTSGCSVSILCDFRLFQDKVRLIARLNVLVSPTGDLASRESSKSVQVLEGLNEPNGKFSSDPEQSQYSGKSKNDRNFFLKVA